MESGKKHDQFLKKIADCRLGMVLAIMPLNMSTSNPVGVRLDSLKQDFEFAMQESTRTGLWFSPDYTPEVPPEDLPKNKIEEITSTLAEQQPAIQLPPGLPTNSYQEPLASIRDERALNILIWSKSTEEAEHIQQALRGTGFSNLWYATSYEDGLDKMKVTHFDFFIIDLSIDGVGTKLIKALRSSLTYRHTPMLICTESQLVQDMLRAMKAGANDLICKPINAELLTKKISLHSRLLPAA